MTLSELRELSIQGLKNYEFKVLNTYRKRLLFDEAVEANHNIYEVYKERVTQDNELSYQDVSRIEYEIAFIYLLIEKVEQSIEFFNLSLETAQKAGDQKGYLIAKHCLSWMKYYTDFQPIEESISQTQRHRGEFSNLMNTTDDSAIRSTCEGWIYNTDSYLLELAIESHDIELAEHSFPRVIQYLNDHDMRETGTHRTIVSNGMLHLVKKEYEQSIKQLAKVVDVDLSEWADRDKELIDYIARTLEFTPSRDYLYAGRALLGLGESNLALSVFHRGMEFSRTSCNYFFLNKIEKEIENLA